jgi:hypothetical protein
VLPISATRPERQVELDASQQRAQDVARVLSSGSEVLVRTRPTHPGEVARWPRLLVEWADGPSPREMRELAARWFPAAVAGMRFRRRFTGSHEATALLLWLGAHPEHLDDVGLMHLAAAREQVSHPERADERTIARGRALLEIGGTGRVEVDALAQLVAHARGGWPALGAWLDSLVELVARQVPAPVVHLDRWRAARADRSQLLPR